MTAVLSELYQSSEKKYRGKRVLKAARDETEGADECCSVVLRAILTAFLYQRVPFSTAFAVKYTVLVLDLHQPGACGGTPPPSLLKVSTSNRYHTATS